jgi:hypothetical protein
VVVELRFLHSFTQSAIAARIGVSQVQVLRTNLERIRAARMRSPVGTTVARSAARPKAAVRREY